MSFLNEDYMKKLLREERVVHSGEQLHRMIRSLESNHNEYMAEKDQEIAKLKGEIAGLKYMIEILGIQPSPEVQDKVARIKEG